MTSMPVVRRRHFLIAMAALLLPLGACSSSHLGAHALLDAPATPRGISVSVSNENYYDMRVYAVVGTTLYPVGSVRSAETRTFSVPTPIFGGSSEVRLRAVPLGSQDSYTSEWIAAGPGDRVEWKLASILKLSTFQVR